MPNILKDDFLDSAGAPLLKIVNDANNEVLSIMAKRIKEIGTLTPDEVAQVASMARISDINAIKNALAQMTEKSPAAIDEIFSSVARYNEQLAADYYAYRKIEQIPFAEHRVMSEIVNAAKRRQVNDVLNLAGTSAFNYRGKALSIREAYTRTLDKAVFTVQQGYTDYNTAMRSTIRELADSGIQAVSYKSNRTMNIYSAVRMNLLDNTRQMSLAMRDIQAKEYGADAWQISAHGMCRPSHQAYQGRIFTFQEFEEINNGDLRSNPIATGEYNCHHTKVGVIKAIASNAYSRQELKELKDYSNEKITFQDREGEDVVMSRYEVGQVQRQYENQLRMLNRRADMYRDAGNELDAKRTDKYIKATEREYRSISKAADLKPKMNRTKI